MIQDWHKLSAKEVIKVLGSDETKGLEDEETRLRQKKFGKNKLPQKKELSSLKILLEQFKSPLIFILILAGIVVIFLKEYLDGLVIWGAVFLNIVVGFFQENKASKALQKLSQAIKLEAQVLRLGNIKVIDSEKIVPGDIFFLKPGDKIPADGRIVTGFDLKTNESALTGEWLAAEKTSRALPEETPLADRDNMVYMGTIVVDGKAKVIATGTGLKTEIGKVATLIKKTGEEKTPLQKKIARFGRIIGLTVSLICLLIFIEGIVTGNSFSEMLVVSVAVAVAAIPEGLPVAMIVILAVGMERILKRKGLVRKLLAAETLGSTSIICTDKTLTLTEGKMEVVQTFTLNEDIKGDNKLDWQKVFKTKAEFEQMALVKTSTLVNEAFIENPQVPFPLWKIGGRPTDKALLMAGAQVGIEKPKLEKEEPEIWNFPFKPEEKFIASLRETEKKKMLYMAGAPGKILSISKYVQHREGKRMLGQKIRNKVEKKLEEMTQSGQRVIGIAYKETKNSQKTKGEIKDLTFIGLIGLKDPLRKGAKEAVKVCRQAGLKPIIVTGDHLLTAKAIAQELGIKAYSENVLEGKEIDKMSEKAFLANLEKIKIYARVEPRHKLKIVEAWQKKGKVVAMTGDGINDAPALKKADVGVALGSATDIAKEVSDLILLDDNFNTIVGAVEEGRTIIDNMRKTITYLLSDAFSEVVLIAGSLILGFPLPILPAQILWTNLIEDGLPGIALGFEPKEKDIMKRKPQAQDTPLLTREMKALIFIIGIVDDFLLLGLFFWLMSQGHNLAYVRTMVFAALAIDTVFASLSCKSLRKNLWHINIFSNKFLIFAIVFGILALAASLYLTPLQILLKTVPLGISDWLIILCMGMAEIFLVEITKYYFIVKKQL